MELDALLASEIALPSIPRVVALLMLELDKEESDLRRITQLISTDPALTARLLQLANSAFFHLERRVNGVAEALAVLGLNHVRTLVSAAAVGGAFRAGLLHAVGEVTMDMGMSRDMGLLNREHGPLDLKRAGRERKRLGFC